MNDECTITTNYCQPDPDRTNADTSKWTNVWETVADSDTACQTAGRVLTGNENATGYVVPGIGVLSECVSVSRCLRLLDDPYAPLTRTIACGFDTNDHQVLVILNLKHIIHCGIFELNSQSKIGIC